jgi:hypothetical protein
LVKLAKRNLKNSAAMAATPNTPAPVLGFCMSGWGDEHTDPAADEFADRVRAALGITVEGPCRYWQTDYLVRLINCVPLETKVYLWGSSLGGNNTTVVAQQVTRTINGVWVFQASQFGAKNEIPSNVEFFHCVFNPFLALGSFKAQLASGNSTTLPLWTERWAPHPGDQDKASQDMFLDDMDRRAG